MGRLRFTNQIFVLCSVNRRLLDDLLNGHPHIPGTLGSFPSSNSRPTLGFPLGTALVLLIIFTISVLFSCCYHWEKIRRSGRLAFLQRNEISARHAGIPLTSITEAQSSSEDDCNSASGTSNKLEKVPSLPVVMPGDDMPKFLAWPCPHVELVPNLIEDSCSLKEMQASETAQAKRSHAEG